VEATTFPWSLARSSTGQRAIALLPAHVLTASLRRIYRAKAFSDLSYLFGSGWLLMLLLLQVIPSWNSKASGGAPWDVRPLLLWLWILLFFYGFSRFSRRSGPVGWLFDHVVQCWRSVGQDDRAG
jgi:hypothetical protein